MDIVSWIFMSVLLMVADGFSVHGPSAPLVAPLGSSVVLPCYVDDGLMMEDLEVEWRRTGLETLVHLYLNGESRPEAQQQDYRDRANFFTEEVQHGNFSLRLDNLRAEDEGNFTCRVYIQQDSGETEIELKYVERLLVSGSNHFVSTYGGEDVTLNCSVDSHITPEHIEEVSWKKTDKDGYIPVLLYQNNVVLAEVGDEQYRGRVEFFTAEIPKGNFSLRLKSVKTEDKGVYICEVFAGDLSANATVIVQQLGFSSWHIAVLVFCFAAGSGALLLLCLLIYCRSKNTDTLSTIWKLQLSLVFFPNICLFLAFLLWGFTEGSLDETVTCCALYILRPMMLIWTLPCLKYLQGNLKPRISFFTTGEFAFLTVVVYSVLFSHGWRIRAHDTTIIPRVTSGVLFVIVVLLCLINAGFGFKRFLLFNSCIFFLPILQLPQLLFSFGFNSLGSIIVVMGCAFLLCFMPFLLYLPAFFKCLRRKWLLLLWIITTPLLDIIIVIYGHLVMLEKEKDCLEWICVIVFLELLKIVAVYASVKQRKLKTRKKQQTEVTQQGSNAYHLCNDVMYMFGAVGLVLLTSVTLTAELILKARNGERVIEDLRVVVFPSECAFALCWLVIQIHAYRKTFTGFTHSQRNTPQRRQLGSTEDSHEMEILSAADSAVSQ